MKFTSNFAINVSKSTNKNVFKKDFPESASYFDFPGNGPNFTLVASFVKILENSHSKPSRFTIKSQTRWLFIFDTEYTAKVGLGGVKIFGNFPMGYENLLPLFHFISFLFSNYRNNISLGTLVTKVRMHGNLQWNQKY